MIKLDCYTLPAEAFEREDAVCVNGVRFIRDPQVTEHSASRAKLGAGVVRMTNIEKLISERPEELAAILAESYDPCRYCVRGSGECRDHEDCTEGIVEWMWREADGR